VDGAHAEPRWGNPQAYEALRAHLRASLPLEPDSSLRLTARAWALRGIKV
jgi:hypothetical protein